MGPAGRLEGKTALVTGAGRGIGRAIALLMAREGARVLVADNGSLVNGAGTDPAVAERVVEEIRERGGEALGDGGDVASMAAAERMVGTAIDAWGRLDILVNAAGNFRLSSIADIAEEDWDEVISTHLRGTFCTTRVAVPHWRAGGGPGRIINFTSAAGTVGLPNMVSYSTAKAGIIGFTRACANALAAFDVTANSISPGAATRMSDRSGGPSAVATFRATDRWPRETTQPERNPAHVAPLVVYLASDAAANISGRIFGASGQRYALLSEPEEVRVLFSEGPWDLDRLFDEFPLTLGQGLSLQDLGRPLDSLDLPLEGDFPHELLG